MTATTSSNWRQKSTLPPPAPSHLHPLPPRPEATSSTTSPTNSQKTSKPGRRHSFSGIADAVPSQAKAVGYATEAGRPSQPRVVALPKSGWNSVRVFGEDLRGNYRNGLGKSLKANATRSGENGNGVKDVGAVAKGGTRAEEEEMVNVKLGNHSVAIPAHPSIPTSLVVDPAAASPAQYDVHHSFGGPVSPNPYYLNESLTPTISSSSFVNPTSLPPTIFYPTPTADSTPAPLSQHQYSEAPRHARRSTNPHGPSPNPYHLDPSFSSPSTGSPSPPEFFTALANPQSMIYQPSYHYGPPNGYVYPPGAMLPVPSSPYFSSPPTEWEYNSSSIPTQFDYSPHHPHTTTGSSTHSNALSPYYSPQNPHWNSLDPNSGFYGPPLVEYLPDLYYPESFSPVPPVPSADQQAIYSAQNQLAYDLGIQYAFSAAGANELGLELMGGASTSARPFGEETTSNAGERTTIDFLRSGNVLRRTGTCKFFDIQKGFGFILDDRIEELGGKDVFVHYTAIRQTAGFRCLSTGEAIEYDIVKATSGGFQALNVCGVDGRALKGLQPAQESLHARNAAGILASSRRIESPNRQGNRRSSTSRPTNRIAPADASPDTTHDGNSIIIDSSRYSSLDPSRPTSQQSNGIAGGIPLLLVKKTSSAVPILPPPASRSISPASKVAEQVEEAFASGNPESTRSNEGETASNGAEEETSIEGEDELAVEGLKL